MNWIFKKTANWIKVMNRLTLIKVSLDTYKEISEILTFGSLLLLYSSFYLWFSVVFGQGNNGEWHATLGRSWSRTYCLCSFWLIKCFQPIKKLMSTDARSVPILSIHVRHTETSRKYDLIYFSCNGIFVSGIEIVITTDNNP